jgi:DNA repair exonuclease SbcCD nuclease subunit
MSFLPIQIHLKSWKKEKRNGQNFMGLKKSHKAILTADWHIRADSPVCRTDDFQKAMWKKVDNVFALAVEMSVPIIIAGDLGHRPQWPNWLIEKFMEVADGYESEIMVVFGQHDIPEHNLELYPRSGIGVLIRSEYVMLAENGIYPDLAIEAFDYSENIEGSDKANIAVAHQMVIEDKPEWPGQVADSAKSLLKKFPEYKLILTGDNHKPFVVEYEGRILVNPGSMMRTTADQIDHKPRVYLWDGEGVEPVYLPIEEGVISREHIDVGQHRDERITAYVERLKTNYEIGLDFKKNMTEHFKVNRTRKEITGRVWEAMEG